MTSAVSGTARPPQPAGATRTAASTPTPEDVEAMRNALANARGHAGKDMPQQQPPLARGETKPAPGQPRAPQAKGMPARQEEAAAAFGQAVRQQAGSERDPLVAEREAARDGGTHGEGLALQQGAPAPVTVPAPPMPPPHVDAAAFAQLMSRLWNRESAKGTREVRVEFGEATWPATGARLVRNAAGALDIELFTADRGTAEQAINSLRAGFAANGIEVGALAVSDS